MHLVVNYWLVLLPISWQVRYNCWHSIWTSTVHFPFSLQKIINQYTVTFSPLQVLLVSYDYSGSLIFHSLANLCLLAQISKSIQVLQVRPHASRQLSPYSLRLKETWQVHMYITYLIMPSSSTPFDEGLNKDSIIWALDDCVLTAALYFEIKGQVCDPTT